MLRRGVTTSGTVCSCPVVLSFKREKNAFDVVLWRGFTLNSRACYWWSKGAFLSTIVPETLQTRYILSQNACHALMRRAFVIGESLENIKANKRFCFSFSQSTEQYIHYDCRTPFALFSAISPKCGPFWPAPFNLYDLTVHASVPTLVTFYWPNCCVARQPEGHWDSKKKSVYKMVLPPCDHRFDYCWFMVCNVTTTLHYTSTLATIALTQHQAW